MQGLKDDKAALGLLSLGSLQNGLDLLLTTGALATAPPELRDLARRCFLTGAWLAYSIQQVAVRRALAQQPDEAAALIQGLRGELQAFEAEAALGEAVAAAGQVH